MIVAYDKWHNILVETRVVACEAACGHAVVGVCGILQGARTLDTSLFCANRVLYVYLGVDWGRKETAYLRKQRVVRSIFYVRRGVVNPKKRFKVIAKLVEM